PPRSSGALPGITASVVKRIAAKLGYEVIERNITVTELYSADEAFLTGTGAEIMPIREVNKRRIGEGKMGPITEKIFEEFMRVVRDPNEGIPIYR
ncbi:MAG: aminotransferase class IV, partial [Candidatus Bathyarchaeia archaeon]